MKSSFTSRRQPRKVGQDVEDEPSPDEHVAQEQDQPQTVIRPSIGPRNGSSKTKKRSSLRTSFGPGGTSMTEDDGDGAPVVFTPKRSNLGRQAVEKNAVRKILAANISGDHLPLRQIDDRPSYSKDHLNELKGFTPSTPKDLRSKSDFLQDQHGNALDLAAKFGSDLIVRDSTSSAIPTDAEIREKKERRARLAKEQDFISLDDDGDGNASAAVDEDDDSNDERSLLPYAQRKSGKKEETRLVRDDEDIAEGFDEFVSDGRIALGRKAEREQKKRQEAEIRDMINEAEGGGSEDSEEDDSEMERHAAYEAAQTRKGMDGLRRAEEERVRPRRPRTPPRITPLPTLGGCVERLKGLLAAKQFEAGVRERRMQEIRMEREDIRARQVEVQRLLRETGERYEKLREEAGLDGQGVEQGTGQGVGQEVGGGILVGVEGMARRGFESLGEA